MVEFSEDNAVLHELPEGHIPVDVILLNGWCLLRDHNGDHARGDAEHRCERRFVPVPNHEPLFHQRSKGFHNR